MLEIDKALEIGSQAVRIGTASESAPGQPPNDEPLAPAPPSRPQQLLELVCKALHAPVGGIGLIAADGKLRELWTVGIAQDVAAELRHAASGAALIHFLLKQASPLRIADFEAFREELGLPAGLGKIGPLLGVPLVYHGRPLGAFYLARPAGQPPFGPQDDQVVLPIREWLAHGDLFEEARLLAQLRLLTQVAQAAAGSRDLPGILHVALHELERHLPLYTTAVWMLQEKPKEAQQGSGVKGPGLGVKDSGPEQEPSPFVHPVVRGSSDPAPGKPPPVVPTGAVVRESPDPAPGKPPSSIQLKLAAVNSVPRQRAEELGLKPQMRVALAETPFAACLEGGQALYIDLTRPDERRSPLIENLAARGANSVFAVPLRAGPQTVGILQTICTRSAGFTNEQIQILYQVADMLGPAICNCQLFSRLRAAYEELRHTQTQLIKAEKMRALGELASGMAHDFNNALCGALGFLELVLADNNLDGIARGHLESARTCTLDAAETVRRVQDFARWQRKEFSVQLVDLNEVVRQTMELARHKWENLNHARGTPISVEIVAEAKSQVCASAAELREVLTNLVFNGVDAMPQGGKLTVRTWNDPENVYLSVSDTGIGISDSVRRRLFEPFFTTKGERGNGLGLSVTFGIVQRYSGDISVESAAGQGATFVVKLPQALGARKSEQPARNGFGLSLAQQKQAPPSPAPAPSAHQIVPRGKGLRILVIEDEESIRRFLSTGLTHLGHSARLAADGAEGLALFAKEPFDVVLTDLGLPGMSGEDVARTIASQSPKTPVILLTGWSHQLREAGKSLVGVTRVLGKPVTLDTLNGALVGVCTT